ncbi:MAG: hypothetical protein IJJ26_08870, partial [Victivallales bacterium]|nr:hypothetical protein [Victivallales bacterium]
MLLSATLLAIGTALLACCVGIWRTESSLEGRILRQQTKDMATTIRELHLPASARLLSQLKRIGSCEAAVVQNSQVLVSTMPGP